MDDSRRNLIMSKARELAAKSRDRCEGGSDCRCCGAGCDCGCRNECPKFIWRFVAEATIEIDSPPRQRPHLRPAGRANNDLIGICPECDDGVIGADAFGEAVECHYCNGRGQFLKSELIPRLDALQGIAANSQADAWQAKIMYDACEKANKYLAALAVNGAPSAGIAGGLKWSDVQTSLAEAIGLIKSRDGSPYDAPSDLGSNC